MTRGQSALKTRLGCGISIPLPSYPARLLHGHSQQLYIFSCPTNKEPQLCLNNAVQGKCLTPSWVCLMVCCHSFQSSDTYCLWWPSPCCAATKHRPYYCRLCSFLPRMHFTQAFASLNLSLLEYQLGVTCPGGTLLALLHFYHCDFPHQKIFIYKLGSSYIIFCCP